MKIVCAFLITVTIFILISCRTNTCPNCVNTKPQYYNSEVAKEVKRTVKHNKRTSATGQTVDPENTDEDKKTHQKRSKKRKNQGTIVNEPIINQR
jgi:hypothetical protein